MDRSNSQVFVDSSFSIDMEETVNRLATEKEPEFLSIGNEIGLKIWRIEKGKVVPWPKNLYGTFYQGDSFIILNTIKEHEYNAHLWIGKDSTPDELGTASFKIIQLDEYLERKCSVLYETQEKESTLFLSYFDVFTVLQGGVDPAELTDQVQKFKPRMFHVTGKGSNVQSREVEINKANMDENDVFVLDIGLKLFNWRGKGATGFERFFGTHLCEVIKKQRKDLTEIITIDDGSTTSATEEEINEFNSFFNRTEEEIKPKSKKVIASNVPNKKMKRLNDSSGSLVMSDVSYDKNSLDTNDAFLIDRGDAIIIWVGKKASRNEKRFAFAFAKKYLIKERAGEDVSIITVQEGKLQAEVDKCF